MMANGWVVTAEACGKERSVGAQGFLVTVLTHYMSWLSAAF